MTSVRLLTFLDRLHCKRPNKSYYRRLHPSLQCRASLGQLITSAQATTAQEHHGLLVAIANTACTDSSRQYQGILVSCGCTTQQGAGEGSLAKYHRSGLGLHWTTWPTSHRHSSGSASKCTPPCLAITLSSLHLCRPRPCRPRMPSLRVELQRAVFSLQQQSLSLPLSLGQLGL